MEVYRIQNVFSFATKEGSKLKTSEAIQASINDSSQVLGGSYMYRLAFLIVCFAIPLLEIELSLTTINVSVS